MTGFEVSGFTITAGLVARAFGTTLPAVSRDVMTPALGGVYVEWSEEKGRVSFAATNRFVAVVASIAVRGENCRGEGSVLISRENVRSLVSTFKQGARAARMPVSFELRADGSLIVSDDYGRTASYRGEDAKFPRSVFGLVGSAVARIEAGDWTPKSVSGLDPQYLKLVLDAAKHATPKNAPMLVFAPQTEGPAFFDLVGDDQFSAAAVLMPVLLKSTPATVSVGWLKDEVEAAA